MRKKVASTLCQLMIVSSGARLAVLPKHRATWPFRGSVAQGMVATVWEFCVQVAAMLRFALLQVDQRLQCRVYLVGQSVSLADLVLFATLYRALVRHTDLSI